MKRFQKYAALLLVVGLLSVILAGCGQKQEIPQEDNDLHIYSSFYPIYAIAEMMMVNIPDAYLHCLVQPQDGCLRDYQLSDWDLALLSQSADMVIVGGHGLESFENILYSLGEEGPAVAAVLYNKELAPAMLEGGDVEEANHWQDANPHLYMSADGAILIAESIVGQLMVADPANSEIYMENLEKAENRLRSVLAEEQEAHIQCAGKKVILMNETAVYIAQALGLESEMVISRDSGEAYYDHELEKLIVQCKECESRVILIEKQAPEPFCEALKAAGFDVVKIDTMSAKGPQNGVQGYIDALIANIKAVEEVFA